MNMFQLSFKNIWHRPGNFILSVMLLALGAGLIFFLLQLDHQLQQKFEKNLAGVDLVLGAKGSPLQLILNSMYHIDAPTGNIKIEDAKPFLNPKHPLIQTAVPLSLGDSYRGYRIVGTTTAFLDLYDLKIQEGEQIQADFEVLLGADIAQKNKLKLGDTFQSTHGFIEDESFAHDHDVDFKVVGILAHSATVADQLIITTNATVVKIHQHDHGSHDAHEHDEQEEDSHAEENHDHHEHAHDHEHNDHDHKHHNHNHQHHQNTFRNDNNAVLALGDDEEITSLLVLFKGTNFQSLNLARNINENTNLMAANPPIELNRLFALMDTGSQLLTYLAIAIVIVSAISVFLSMYSSLARRKKEMALIRVKGASRAQVFLLILLEAFWICLVGVFLGYLLAHGALFFLAGMLESAYKYDFSAFQFLPMELWVVLAVFVIGFVAAVLPAWQVSRASIAEVLFGN